MVQVVAQSKKDSMMEAVAFPLSSDPRLGVRRGWQQRCHWSSGCSPSRVHGGAAGNRFGTDVSVFAMNLVLTMGLALAIDYTLLIVSRFRDELPTGLTVTRRCCEPWPLQAGWSCSRPPSLWP
jgi:RND superfamily putative drug exporter